MEFPTELLLIEGNDICADCGAMDPKWVSVNLGVFLCIHCGSVHRSLGTHISQLQSIVLDNKFTDSMIENLKEKGNKKVNSIYEFNISQGSNVGSYKPTPKSSIEEKEVFIENKYVHHKYSQTDTLTSPRNQVTRTKSEFVGIGPNSDKYLGLGSKKLSVKKEFGNPLKIFHKRSKSVDVTIDVKDQMKQIGMLEYSGILKITLYGAEGLPAKDISGTSDPYFVFRVGLQKVSSKVVKKSLSPFYGRQELMLMMSKPNEPLQISCFDENTLMKDKFMCDAIHVIDEQILLNPGKVFRVIVKLYSTKKECGSVDIDLTWDPVIH